MKNLLAFVVFIGCSVGLVRAGTPTLNERLAATYLRSVPGSVWTLSLSDSGGYSLATRGSFEKDARPIESGTWRFEGFAVVLKSDQKPVGGNAEYRSLHVLQTKSGQVMLVSALRIDSYVGQPVGDDILFDYVFFRIDAYGAAPKKEANQALQHNDPSCHVPCLRTYRASRGRG